MRMLDWLDSPSASVGVRFAPDEPEADWAFVTYAQLAEDAFRVAGLLARHGLSRNDVVSLIVSEPRDFLVAFYGTLVAGGTPSPLATPLTFRSVEAYIGHLASVLGCAEPAIILVDPALGAAVEQAVAALPVAPIIIPFGTEAFAAERLGARKDPAELALLQFTSGSSGAPKGVRVTVENLASNVASLNVRLGVSSADTTVSWLPHYHDMGLIGGLIVPTTFGTGLRLLKPTQFVRAPLRWLEAIGRADATATVAPSFGYAYAARRIKPADLEGCDFSAWRVALIAAERTDPVGIRRFVELVEPHGFSSRSLAVAYGLAEATLAVSCTRPGEPVPLIQLEQSSLRDGEPVVVGQQAVLGGPVSDGNWLTSCGTANDTVKVDIVDADGNTLPERFHGQIRVRGSGVAHGYKSAPHAQTSTSFQQGALLTGDTGFFFDGELYTIGRMGDSIKVRGVKLYAEDVDAKISVATGLHPGRHTTLLGAVDGVDVVVAIVESVETPWLATVRSVLASVTSENVAVAVFRGDPGAIERTSSGKPRRRVLWRRLLDGDLPVELAHTSWPEAAQGPAPWELAATAPIPS